MSQIDNAGFLQRQLRAQKGVAARLRKENEKLRQQLAKEKLKAPMNDLLLVIMRLCRGNHDLLLDLLDKREGISIVEHKDTPGGQRRL